VAFIGVLTVTVIAGILFSNPIKDRAMKGINEALVCQKALNTAQQDVVCNTSLGLRTFYYVTAIERISLAPILGHGTGNVRMKIGPWDISNPHNEYLMQGLQIGLLGIVLYVALLLACMKMALSLPKVWACFVFGAVTAYMAGSLFNSFLLDFAEGYVLITLFALIVAACEINRQRTEECADA
jgi:O-antigen ligase